jgi:probable phosphoglycerate mutase
MALKVYLLRHGQTAFSRANAFCGSGTDAELTEHGVEMALAFAGAYSATPWQAVYCSPLKRAVDTAQPLCDALGLKMEVRDGLKEISYGQWEGQSVETVKKAYHDDHLQWTADPAWHAPTGGEPAILIARRGVEVIEEILSRHKEGNVLVVSHKATIRVIVCALLGIDVGRFRFRIGCPVASVSVIEFGSHGPLLHVLADRSHLPDKLKNLPGT